MLRIEEDQVQYKGRISFVTLPDVNQSESRGGVVPDVTNLSFLVFVNLTPLDVTNFHGGFNGQILNILGDGNTTIDNNSTIKTSTGANKLLSVKLYIFVYYNGVWYEKA